MSVEITAAEWTAEIERLYREKKDQQEGLTTGEIAERLGMGDAAARKRIKAMLKARELVVCRKTMENMAGQLQPVVAYRRP